MGAAVRQHEQIAGMQTHRFSPRHLEPGLAFGDQVVGQDAGRRAFVDQAPRRVQFAAPIERGRDGMQREKMT